MRRQAHVLVIAIVLGIALVGGLVLARYTTGVLSPGVESASADTGLAAAENMAGDGAVNDAALAATDTPANSTPENYVCHGCGPTLAQRQMDQLYTGGGSDGSMADIYAREQAKLPPQEPMPFSDEPVRPDDAPRRPPIGVSP